MKICVIGAGVVGLSTAYALGRAGHDITVIDKHKDVAGGASHSNGAQLSYSYVDPFAGPASLRALPKYLLGQDPAIRLRPSLRLSYWRWGIGFLRHCTRAKESENLRARAALSLSSARAFERIAQDLPGGALQKQGTGKLVLLPDENARLAAIANRDKYISIGLEREVLSRDDVLAREPALQSFGGDFAGAVYAASDFALDPRVYCRALKQSLAESGAELRFGETVNALTVSGNRISGLTTPYAALSFDAVILCAGNDVNALLKPLKLAVPIYPMQGYSLTAPSTHQSPRVSVTSVQDKIVFANLGAAIRIAGFMDANQPAKAAERRGQALLSRAKSLWPDIADYDNDIALWTGFRPMTPSGVPVIEAARIKGLYVNAGHGSLGYTFAAGSAVIIADLIGQTD